MRNVRVQMSSPTKQDKNMSQHTFLKFNMKDCYKDAYSDEAIRSSFHHKEKTAIGSSIHKTTYQFDRARN